MMGSSICKTSGDAIESVEHVLFSCESAKEVWRISPVRWDGLEEVEHDFWKWWERLHEAGSRKEGDNHIQLTVNILWQIWKRRNRVVFNNEKAEGRKVIETTTQEWMELEQINKKNEEANRCAYSKASLSRDAAGWNSIRIKLDVHICKERGRLGYSCIALNHLDEIIMVCAAPEVRDAIKMMELANAVKLALLIAKHKGWNRVIIQTTSKKLMGLLMNNDVNDALCATILENV